MIQQHRPYPQSSPDKRILVSSFFDRLPYQSKLDLPVAKSITTIQRRRNVRIKNGESSQLGIKIQEIL
jgi:hypothetical protein